jgi:hypothetical protein
MPIEPTNPRALLIPASEPLPQARRLIVLIPNAEMNDALLARQIWVRASARGLPVLFLGLVRTDDEEMRVRRRLITLAAITRDDRTSIETQLRFGRDWLKAVRSIWRVGDVVICQSEQLVSRWGRKPQPLGEVLASSLNTPIYLFSGLYRPLQASRSQRISRFIYETVPLAIIAGFFEFQVQMAQTARGWTHTVLMGLSVAVEFSLIWLWTTFRS